MGSDARGCTDAARATYELSTNLPPARFLLGKVVTSAESRALVSSDEQQVHNQPTAGRTQASQPDPFYLLKTMSEVRVMRCLERFAMEGRAGAITRAMITQATGVCERMVQTAEKRLTELGLIASTPCPNPRHGLSYVILVPVFFASHVQSGAPQIREDCDGGTHSTSPQAGGGCDTGVQSASSQAVEGCYLGVQSVSPRARACNVTRACNYSPSITKDYGNYCSTSSGEGIGGANDTPKAFSEVRSSEEFFALAMARKSEYAQATRQRLEASRAESDYRPPKADPAAEKPKPSAPKSPISGTDQTIEQRERWLRDLFYRNPFERAFLLATGQQLSQENFRAIKALSDRGREYVWRKIVGTIKYKLLHNPCFVGNGKYWNSCVVPGYLGWADEKDWCYAEDAPREFRSGSLVRAGQAV